MGQDLLQQGAGAGVPPTGNDTPPEGQGQGPRRRPCAYPDRQYRHQLLRVQQDRDRGD